MLSISTVSSKGQVVIPKSIREKMGLIEGDRILVYATGDIIVLRRIRKEENVLSTVSASVREKIMDRGVRVKDVEEAIASVRKAKAESSP